VNRIDAYCWYKFSAPVTWKRLVHLPLLFSIQLVKMVLMGVHIGGVRKLVVYNEST